MRLRRLQAALSHIHGVAASASISGAGVAGQAGTVTALTGAASASISGASVAGQAQVVTVTALSTVLDAGAGGTVQQLDGLSPYNTTVAIRFNTDGTVETGKAVNGGALTFSAAGNWITGGTADSSYSVRCTSVTVTVGTGNWTTTPVANDSWISLAGVRTWLSNKTTAGEREFTCTFEVRKTAGAPPTTGSSNYTFDIDNII